MTISVIIRLPRPQGLGGLCLDLIFQRVVDFLGGDSGDVGEGGAAADFVQIVQRNFLVLQFFGKRVTSGRPCKELVPL